MPAISLLGGSVWLCSQFLVSWVVYREASAADYRSPLVASATAFVFAHVLLVASRSLLTVLLVELGVALLYLLVDVAVARRAPPGR